MLWDPSWGCAPGFPCLPVPVWAAQGHSWHCPCFWELKVCQLILLAFLACCFCWEGPSLLGVLSRSSPYRLLAQSRVLPADFPMVKPLETRTLCFALLEEFAIQLKNAAKKVEVCQWLVIRPWPGRLYKLQILSGCSFLENWGFVATFLSLPCCDILPV